MSIRSRGSRSLLPTGPNLVTERGLAQIWERIGQLEQQLAAPADEAAAEEARRSCVTGRPGRRPHRLRRNLLPKQAAFGSRVRFRLNGTERMICIVGDDEADPAGGLISFSAPLARALLGGEVGDQLPFAPARKMRWKYWRSARSARMAP